jgi:hypothetical protein
MLRGNPQSPQSPRAYPSQVTLSLDIYGESRWAFPDRIAFEKIGSFSWQDEYRLAFSTTDALEFEKTSQQIQIPASGSAGLPKPSTIAEPREYNVTTRSLRDICRIHVF